jgi:hypothetical protein
MRADASDEDRFRRKAGARFIAEALIRMGG